ncbi:MAG: dihydrodipicolinate synthase family protein [bacterium]
MNVDWAGIFPAVTTKFKPDENLDLAEMARHCDFQIDSGVHGLVVTGSLGENGVLTAEEKQAVLKTAVSVSSGRVPVLACVAEATPGEACKCVETGAKNGADGFMLLPPMRYVSDARETLHYLRTVAKASDRPIMIYNNPVAYGVDVTPAMFTELADEPTFAAIKESSDDVRRITDIINLVGDRYRIFCGVDNLALEALVLGSDGWLAGLVCAFPKETVAIYKLVKAERLEEAVKIFRWFKPLLDLDVSTKLVQNIKLAEAMAGVGNENVRAPRLPLTGAERERVQKIIARALESRPELPEL